jgi:hypothetical protein
MLEELYLEFDPVGPVRCFAYGRPLGEGWLTSAEPGTELLVEI